MSKKRFVATPEKIIEINELFLQLKNKKKVAEILECSPATVSKYIDPNFVAPPPSQDVKFEGTIGNADWLTDFLKACDNAGQHLCKICMLADEEKEELKELQMGIKV